MVVRILLGLLLLALALGADTALAERPTECADDDKVSRGSRFDQQMCKWDLNLSDITHVELVIEEIEHQNAPYCQRVYRFYGVNYERDFRPVVSADNAEGTIRSYDSLSAAFYKYYYDIGDIRSWQSWHIRLQRYGQGSQPRWSDWFNFTDTISHDDLISDDRTSEDYFYFSGGNDNYIDFRSRGLYPVSEVVSLETGTVEYPLMQLALSVAGIYTAAESLAPYYTDRFSPGIPPPPNRARSSWGVQMNACLDNIQSRLDSEAEMRRIEEERVAQEARAKADAAIAERKAAEEAAAAAAEAEAVRLAAESQARVDAIKLASAKELERKAQETELARTQALKASFERKKAIDAVLSNIIRIRLAGIEERRALTKTFLEAQVAVSDEFKTEVAEYESRIAEYDKLNGLLLDHLDNHRALMERKIEEAQAAEEEQRRRLDDIVVVPGDNATSTPTQ